MDDAHEAPVTQAHADLDVVHAHAEPDAVHAHAEPDVVHGHAEPGVVHGHAERDVVHAHAEPDVVHGHAELDIVHAHADLGDLRLHYVTAGSGFPVVLLHGWPQSWYEWRHIIPTLAQTHRVIAPDLRGLGDSSRPASGYDKKTIANDIWRLVHETLGLSEFYLVGHDWGGPTAYALAAAHPDAVKKLVILDVTIPGDGSPNISQGGRRWHHAFHQTLDLPEALITGREDIYFGWFYRNYGARPLSDAEINEYLRTYRQPGALRAGFAYYRAIPQDIADNAARLVSGFRLPMPVLALGGDRAWGRGPEVVESLRRLATNVQGGVMENCGHWVPEEQPEQLLRHLADFFSDHKA